MKEFNGVELHPGEEIKTIFRQYAAKPMAPFTISFLLLVLAFVFFLPLWYMRIWHWNVFLLGRIVFWAMIVLALYVAIRAWIVRGAAALGAPRMERLYRRALRDPSALVRMAAVETRRRTHRRSPASQNR